MRDGELAGRLVVKRSASGRCSYDEDAKQELVETCLRPGASVARIAREHGLNANLVHTWISLYRKARCRGLPGPELMHRQEVGSAFVPVVTTPVSGASRDLRLDVTLANGIQADLRSLSREDVLAILPALASL